jgi:carbamoyl-phosphate synthase small subunit
MKGYITDDISDLRKVHEEIEKYEVGNVVEEVTCKKLEKYNEEAEKQVALLDYGYKKNILNSLLKRGVGVTVYPATTTAEEILKANPDGIMLSNGPGDPEDCKFQIENVKKLYDSDTPIFGICLGHQLMGLATGAKTAKLKYGHRGPNHPVKDLETRRVYVTSQNHGYYILETSIDPEIAEVSHINLNDRTVEGIKYKNKNIFTVQFHPEACPGPEDTAYLFDKFIEMI